jgi:polyhydroxyalkanoate synthesis regulator phasin
LHQQIFIEQLIEINDISIDDLEEITRLTVFKLKLQNNLDTWLQQGEITSNEVADFKKDAIEQWRNKHKSSYRGDSDEKEHNNTALNVLDSIREKKLTLCQQPMNTSLSNGTFYDLSDSPVIGWRKDWRKYKK